MSADVRREPSLVTFPLYSRSFKEARALQFKIVDAATRFFSGGELLDLGDLGVHRGENRPLQTIRVEKVFADAFDAEEAVLVRGAGTGALRWAILSCVAPCSLVMVHDAPMYPTTQTTLDTMGCTTVRANFNDDGAIAEACSRHAGHIDGVLVQHSRQSPDDSYELGHVIELFRNRLRNVPIVTDDNYAACKVKSIGSQLGADLATFSCFKVLGPEGVGVVLGRKHYVDKIRSLQYSGGSQVQGHEAMEALRGLVYAPVALSITGEVCDEVAQRLNDGELDHVRAAYVANAESKAVIVEFDDDVADRILELAPAHGVAPHPVGCESRYEFAPMFYRISATFRAKDPTWQKRMVRINVMRSGANTVIRILRELLDEIYQRG